jgi:hypothetical protein
MMERREPASGFTARVMEQVRRESVGERREQKVVALQPRRSQRYWRWAAVGALAASVMIGVVVEQRRSDRREAEAAEAQLYETLLLVGEKMNQARTEIRGSRTEGVVQ